MPATIMHPTPATAWQPLPAYLVSMSFTVPGGRFGADRRVHAWVCSCGATSGHRTTTARDLARNRHKAECLEVPR